MGLGPVIPDEQHRATALLQIGITAPNPGGEDRGDLMDQCSRGTTSHRPSAPPRSPAGARSKRGPRTTDPGQAVLTRRRLGHPILVQNRPDAAPLGTLAEWRGDSTDA